MDRCLRVLGLIPARGGSKGVPGKNLRSLGGKPLLAWTAEAALAARSLDRVILSTDDSAIAMLGRSLHLDVPFLRPAELAKDETPTLDVVVHALRWLERAGDPYDAVALLQPTSPFRSPELIDRAVALLQEREATSVVTMRPVPHRYHPHWVFLRQEDGGVRLTTGERDPIPRRQMLPEALARDGRLYVTRSWVVLEQRSLYGDRCFPLCVPDEEDVNLDTLEDFAHAERLLERKLTHA
jgi:CMP-N,N'-diacetyllegionaminic acid synthase